MPTISICRVHLDAPLFEPRSYLRPRRAKVCSHRCSEAEPVDSERTALAAPDGAEERRCSSEAGQRDSFRRQRKFILKRCEILQIQISIPVIVHHHKRRHALRLRGLT